MNTIYVNHLFFLKSCNSRSCSYSRSGSCLILYFRSTLFLFFLSIVLSYPAKAQDNQTNLVDNQKSNISSQAQSADKSNDTSHELNDDIDNIGYWEMLPSEPRIRWSPDKDNNILGDWQVNYKLNEDSLKIGNVDFGPKSLIWENAKNKGECQVLQSELLTDKSAYKLCPLTSSLSADLVKLNGVAAAQEGAITLSLSDHVTAEFTFLNSKQIVIAEFKSPQIKAVDISTFGNKWNVLLQNRNFKPITTTLFGATFPFQEKLYKINLKSNQFLMPYRGYLGVSFGRSFFPPSLDSNSLEYKKRPIIVTNRPLITYSDKIKFKVKSPTQSGYKIQTWTAENLKNQKWTILTQDMGSSKVNYSVLKMPNIEASFRVAIAKPAAGNLYINGEFAVIGSIENLFSSYYDSWWNHRLSWRARGWQSIDQTSLLRLNMTQAELRFNFLPSAWNIEPTFGLLVAQYQFEFYRISAQQTGAGFYWGRSLPSIFDRALRTISFFNYPKYTDLDFTYIPPHDPKAEANFILNFHGKMFFPNSTFFEGGISVFRFSTYNPLINQKQTVDSYSGTLGWGLMF